MYHKYHELHQRHILHMDIVVYIMDIVDYIMSVANIDYVMDDDDEGAISYVYLISW